MTDDGSLDALITDALVASPANPFTTCLIKIHRLLVSIGRHDEAGRLAMVFPNNDRAREWLVEMRGR